MSKILPAVLMLLVSAAAGASDEVGANRRSVQVSGQGEVSAKPDRARLSLGVEVLNTELKTAEAQVNQSVRSVLIDAKNLGLKDEQISTAGISISPEYVWDEKARRQKFNGYRVSRQIVLELRDLDKIGDMLLAATRDGVNQISAPQLESSNAKELRRQALVMAAEDASSKAQRLAEALGVKLGLIRNLNASDTSAPPMMPKVMAMRDASAPSGNDEIGFSAGEIKYAASVTAEFDLIAP